MTDEKRVQLSFEIGRGWRSAMPHRAGRREVAKILTHLLHSSILPLLEGYGLQACGFLGDLAWAQEELVKTLADSPALELGARLYSGTDRLLLDDRDEEIAYLAALGQQVTGRRLLYFRTDIDEFDAELGPSLIRHGFVADFSALEGEQVSGVTLPRAPWWASRAGDLTEPGHGRLLELPLSVDAALESRRFGLDPIPFAPFRIADKQRLMQALDAWCQREEAPVREDGGMPSILHLTFELEDLLDGQRRRSRFGQLEYVLRWVQAQDEILPASTGAMLGQLAGRPVAAATSRHFDDENELARAGQAFEAAGGRIVRLSPSKAKSPGWPLDEAMAMASQSARPDEQIWLELSPSITASALTTKELLPLCDLLAPGRGLKTEGLLAGPEGRACAALFRRVASPVAPRVCPQSGPSAETDLPLSFCIISNGARPDDLARVIAAIHMQEIADPDIMVVGRYEGPNEAGLRIIAAESEADSGRLGAMRNRAAAAARHDHLVVLDDDILLSPGWYRALCARYARKPHFDVLTSRVLLPEGGRYWDHCSVGGPRGHALLEAEESDEFVYMTGGGAWIMARSVFEQIGWCEDRAFYEGEDVDLARRVQAAGFRIEHEAAMICFHDAKKYTNVGRVVLERGNNRGPEWVNDALEGLGSDEALSLAEGFVTRRELAEAADVLRYVVRRFPQHERATAAWRLMQCRRGGALRGTSFSPEGCSLYRRTREEIERQSTRVLGGSVLT